MAKLPPIGRHQVIERLECRWIAGLDAEPLSRARINTVVQRDFEHLRHVQVAVQVVVLLAKGPHLHAAAGAAVARILHGLSHPYKLLHDQVGVEDGGLAKSRANDFRRALHEAVGIVLAELDGGARLDQPHLLDHVENHVRHIVHAVCAFLGQSAQANLREVGIGAALLGGHADLRRRGLVVELDPQAL